MTTSQNEALMLGALLDAIPDAVLFSDDSGKITRVNPAAARLFGYDPADLMGKPVEILMPRGVADRHEGFMRAYLETGKARIIGRGRRVEGVRSNGDMFPLHLSIGHAKFGGAEHFVAILHDLTEQTTAEQALARSARLDAIGQMTSGIGHDFSNILTVIMGNLELLDAKLTDKAQQAMLADAREAAELGAELTAGLSAFGRQSPIHCSPVHVAEACKSAIAMLSRTLDPHYRIHPELLDGLPTVRADNTQLQSAIINIALNARDAMPDGGDLSIRAEEISIDDRYIAQELDVAQGHYVRVSVTDTGRGMGPDTQQRVFEPFFTTKPLGQGTGLGLAMVYGFVRQCNGHVTVYSEIGLGTTIALYFPVITEGGAQMQMQDHRPPRRAAQGRKVLLVEDNPQVRKLTAARLKDLGYHVREAESGDSAAQMLRDDPQVHAVFTDLVMPGDLDGLALARHIVATYPDIRILLTSGYADDILNRQQNDLSHQILRKPYRQSDLATALSALFTEESS